MKTNDNNDRTKKYNLFPYFVDLKTFACACFVVEIETLSVYRHTENLEKKNRLEVGTVRNFIERVTHRSKTFMDEY